MAKDKSYQYLDLAKPILPYISYTSPVNESPHFCLGSQNVMASQIGYLEKRPGFSQKVSGTTGFSQTINRIFTWRRWSGSFFIMISVEDGGVAKVLKLEVGVDTNFNLIWTSTTDVPFDFVVSDNFCFFGNSTDMRKFDGTKVTKWGCDPPPAAPEIAFIQGSLPPGMTFTPFILSGTPTALGSTQIAINATEEESLE